MHLQTKRFLSHSLILLALLVAFLPQGAALAGTTIQVTTTADELNNDGDCSLREAIQAANSNLPVDACPAGTSASADEIRLPQGTFQLSIAGADEDANQSGDLDITESVDLVGAGADATILDANSIDRVLQVSGPITVNFLRLSITGGVAPSGASESRGGGLLVQGSSVVLSQVVVHNNQASTSGGGIDNFGGRVTLSYSILRQNQALRGGGIFNGNSLVIENSLVINNTASLNGGGVDNFGAGTLENATFTGNSAGNDPDTGDSLGSAVFSDGNISMVNVTLSGNNGAAFNNAGEGRLANVIMAANGPANCIGPIISEGSNLEDKDTCGFDPVTDLVNSDPLLDELAQNGGFTQTFALLAGSPAIDRGNPDRCPATDQRGAFRPADGDLNGSAVCDIGAFEFGAEFGNLYLPLLQRGQ